MKIFDKILVANRGEIAARIIRSAQKQGIHTVAVYASDDVNSLHVSMADKSVLLPGKTLTETYLNIEKIIAIALETGAGAIHPGYGFLSENAGFAQKVTDAGLVFIGPTPGNIHLMGEKNQALEYVKTLGIPVLTSFSGSVDELLKYAPEMQFPMMVKASGGGGGRGMIICNSAEELLPNLRNAERQALSYFGNGELFVEKYLPRARHVEVQLMADHFGNVVHFYERECSVQRHFQKIIEEAPSISVDEKLRMELTTAAVKIARSMNYRNAGTIEFLLDENGNYFFLEMNTRIQVEHPVTEMITNTDLIALQLLIASGLPLQIRQEDIKISGHAIEVRLCAEDAEHHFQPSAGEMTVWQIPENPNLRVETFVSEKTTISPNYDSLLAKLIVCSPTREQAIGQMKQALLQTAISGVHTNLPFLTGLVESEEFIKNQIYTSYLDQNLAALNRRIQDKKEKINKHKLVIAYLIFRLLTHSRQGNTIWSQIGFWRINPNFEVTVDCEKFEGTFKLEQKYFFIQIDKNEYQISIIKESKNRLELNINQEPETFHYIENDIDTNITYNEFSFGLRSNLFLNEVSLTHKNTGTEEVFQNLICADLFGKVLNLNIQAGNQVSSGQILLTLESMKTEIHVLCPVDAWVKKVHVKEGNAVVEKQVLVELEKTNASYELQVTGLTRNPKPGSRNII